MTNSFKTNPIEKSQKNFSTLLSGSQSATYTNYVVKALKSADASLSMEELTAIVKPNLPVGEEVQTVIQQAVDKIYQVVEVTPGRYGWLSNLASGAIIRHPLTAEEARQGFLLLDELEHALLFPDFFQTHRSNERILYIELFGGPTIPAEAYIERKTWSLRLEAQFVKWIDDQGGQGRDDIIIIANDVKKGHYTLRLHPKEARDDSLIQSRNVQLTLKAEEMVRETQKSKAAMTTWDLAAKLLVQGAYREAVPPDDLHCVLHQYSLLYFDSNAGYMLKEDGVGNIHTSDNRNRYSGTPLDNPLTNAKYDFPAVGDNSTEYLNESGTGMDESSASDKEYDRYLDKLFQSGIMDSPFTEHEYRMLRAELESLVQMEEKFGYLLSEQRNRQHDLVACLLIDPSSLSRKNANYPKNNDHDEPPFLER